MSTTVTYKGSTLTTVTNETRTLTTQGKYLEDNITLVDVTSGGSGSGAVWQDAQGYVHLSNEGDIELQTKTVSPTESAQTVLADAGYYALDRVNVNAIPSNYVGSGVTQRTSSDLTASGATVTAPSGYYSSSATKTVASGSATPASSISATGATVSTGTNILTLSKSVSNTPTVSAGYVSSGTAGNSSVSLTASINTRSSSDLSVSGATVTAPAGYYASAASKAVASGTAGTPTATKGTVSNHTVTVTPSVTNTTGYITGSTKTGTGVSVSASELVSGTYSITSSGTKDVTNYASASVPSGIEGTPTATKGAVSNHSVSVTPSVTNSGGYITGSTKTGTAVTVSASELVSGTKSISANGTGIDVTNYASVDVSVSSGATYTATITNTGNIGYCYVMYPSSSGTKYYTNGDTFTIEEGNVIYIECGGSRGGGYIYVNNILVAQSTYDQAIYSYEVPANTNVEITINYGASSALYLNEVVDAISITQNGVYNVSEYDFANVNVSAGGEAASKKQINFIDYDGTILYSYTKTEWQSVTSLPGNPSHGGLTAQGWNWTKAQIDAQLTAVPNDDVWVGQMYITTSGNTEIDVRFADSARLSPYLSCAVNGSITIDWGDNSTSTLTGTSLTTRVSTQHTYASVGDYTITIHVESGSWAFYGTSTYALLNKNNSTGNANRVYSNCVQNVRIGADTSIGSNAFSYCYSLASVTIPSSVTSIGSNAFNYCYSLASVTIPSNVTSIGNSTFSNCYSLASVTIPSNVTSMENYAFNACYSLASVAIPSGVTSIGTYVFYNCYSLASVTIPSDVTNIGNNAFSYCYGVAKYHIKPTTPPTLGATVFNYIQSDCIIYVPSASLTTYQEATSWSTYASYMQGE